MPAKRKSPRPPAHACLSNEEVVRYVGLPARMIDSIIEHVEHCETCRRTVAAAVRASRGER